jgi:hypothetical protein
MNPSGGVNPAHNAPAAQSTPEKNQHRVAPDQIGKPSDQGAQGVHAKDVTKQHDADGALALSAVVHVQRREGHGANHRGLADHHREHCQPSLGVREYEPQRSSERHSCVLALATHPAREY